MKKKLFLLFITFIIVLFASLNTLHSHCDTMEGPLVKDAIKAIEKNNVNYVLKWVSRDKEAEVIKIFKLVMKVRVLNTDARELADNYFFDTVVRIHRNGEGESFTGVKPYGTLIGEIIIAADKSIENGNLNLLKKFVPKERIVKLEELFNKVMDQKNFDVNDVEKGREYIEAYIKFFKYAEGEDESHSN